MSRYIPFVLEDGSIIRIEGSDSGAAEKAGRLETDETYKKFSDAAKAVKPLCAQIKKDFESLEGDETEVSFALKTTGDLDFVVAKLGAEANFQITLKWKKGGA